MINKQEGKENDWNVLERKKESKKERNKERNKKKTKRIAIVLQRTNKRKEIYCNVRKKQRNK